MKVYHDKGGKLYTYNKNGNVEFLFEVMIDQGDNVVKIVNNLLERSDNSDYVKCDTCKEGVSCSGCELFSRYCKKCTEG